MPHSPRSLRIGIASAIALLLIGGAYVVSGPVPFWNVVEAQSAEELLREYATKDSDADGLADWQESLYGTDPYNAESFQPGMLDGEAVAQGLIEPRVTVRPADTETDPDSIPGIAAAPSSLTDRFAQALVQQYLMNRGENPPTQEEILSFVSAAVTELSATSASPDRFGMTDIVAGGSGSAALASYAAAAEGVFLREAAPAEKNELFFFSDALKGDTSALGEIEAIAGMYRDLANGLMEVPVPQEARQAHLAIANALAHLAEASEDMAAMEEDPLRALLGISIHDRYTDDWLAGFSNMSAVFRASGVSLPESAAGYSYIETSNAAAEAR